MTEDHLPDPPPGYGTHYAPIMTPADGVSNATENATESATESATDTVIVAVSFAVFGSAVALAIVARKSNGLATRGCSVTSKE